MSCVPPADPASAAAATQGNVAYTRSIIVSLSKKKTDRNKTCSSIVEALIECRHLAMGWVKPPGTELSKCLGTW